MSKTLRDKYLAKYDGGPPFRPESKPLETYIAFCEDEYDKLQGANAALRERVKVLEEALRWAERRCKTWSYASKQFVCGSCGATVIDPSLSTENCKHYPPCRFAALAPPEPPAEPFVRRNCIPVREEADRG